MKKVTILLLMVIAVSAGCKEEPKRQISEEDLPPPSLKVLREIVDMAYSDGYADGREMQELLNEMAESNEPNEVDKMTQDNDTTYMVDEARFFNDYDRAILKKGIKYVYEDELYYWYDDCFHQRWTENIEGLQACEIPVWAMICNTEREKEILNCGKIINEVDSVHIQKVGKWYVGTQDN